MRLFETNCTQVNLDLSIISSSCNAPLNIDRSPNASCLGSAHKLTARLRSIFHSIHLSFQFRNLLSKDHETVTESHTFCASNERVCVITTTLWQILPSG